MITVKDRGALAQHISALKHEGFKIGYVPTMGALHEGHLSLIRLAHQHADKVIVSIYVNPTQFAPHEDFDSYPRDTDGDLALLKKEGVDVVYLPTDAEMYPNGRESDIETGHAAKGLESDFRPHFFGGVVNVVSRLFAHVQPDIAVFGEKDFQQLQVIRDMVESEGLGIEIIGGPIARDAHGLALSSRNAYLSEEELRIARQLNVVLKDLSLRAQRSTPDNGLPRQADAFLAMTKEAENALLDAGFDKVDYVAHRWGRVLAAAYIGKTRLIDNMETP